MRKRLRKKKHLKEFTDWGTAITVIRNRTNDFEQFIDDFIEQAIEGTVCSFGGGGKEDRLEGVIQLGCKTNRPEERLHHIMNWLKSRDDVLEFKFGPLVNLWHE